MKFFIVGAIQPASGVTALTARRMVRPALLLLFTLGNCAVAMAAEPAIQMVGKGVQIYTCAKSSRAYSWQLKAPDATLTDTSGAVAGHHFAGPTWKAVDGSEVVGTVLVSSPAPQAGSIPWLILAAKSHSGVGRFADVAYIARSQTEGGAPPSSGCDLGHAGTERRVGYSATYVFFPGVAHK